MNIAFWIIQNLLALHTVMGAVWKFSHTAEETMPSLRAIPDGAWLLMAGIEILCAVALVSPVFRKFVGDITFSAPSIGALVIALEMFLFTFLHLVVSKEAFNGQVIYWLVIVAVSFLVGYGRWQLIPHR